MFKQRHRAAKQSIAPNHHFLEQLANAGNIPFILNYISASPSLMTLIQSIIPPV